MVPAPVTSFKNLTMNRDDGILSIHCMSTKDYMKFYNEDKYWNVELKKTSYLRPEVFGQITKELSMMEEFSQQV